MQQLARRQGRRRPDAADGCNHRTLFLASFFVRSSFATTVVRHQLLLVGGVALVENTPPGAPPPSWWRGGGASGGVAIVAPMSVSSAVPRFPDRLPPPPPSRLPAYLLSDSLKRRRNRRRERLHDRDARRPVRLQLRRPPRGPRMELGPEGAVPGPHGERRLPPGRAGRLRLAGDVRVEEDVRGAVRADAAEAREEGGGKGAKQSRESPLKRDREAIWEDQTRSCLGRGLLADARFGDVAVAPGLELAPHPGGVEETGEERPEVALVALP